MNETCPRCQYIRLPSDSGPRWQCPNCGAAYNKRLGNTSAESLASTESASAASRFHELEAKYRPLNKKLYFLILLFTCLTGISAFKKNALIDATQINPLLTQEPIQQNRPLHQRQSEQYSFEYMGVQYNVAPIAEYELWGLVVSHNDIDGISDIYHDETSVDTKDLCVIWGNNILNNDYQLVSYRSGAWTCYFEYDRGVVFNADQLSNNHIITDNDSIRETLEQVQIGDQIHIKGQLVNYQDTRHPEFWRNSSTTRSDAGNTACEVIFANELQILAVGNPLWRTIYYWSWKLLILCLILKTGVFLREITL